MDVRLTYHAIDRILSRTKMRMDELKGLISERAVVYLGEEKDTEFLLFYSHNDRECKIALVKDRRQLIISIWEDWFDLPYLIDRVKPSHKARAKTRYFDYLKRRYRGLQTT